MKWLDEKQHMSPPSYKPSHMAMDKYAEVIEHLKGKCPANEVNWSKIMRATLIIDESVHAYYGRLMQI